ncbi:DUF3016 domain-containing protein [Denitratisoma oestradiolicum]|uniref:DUF3016 domain-containing protein n=1 Tax=Denitratisoma oestradiolicum TaxID=311182 RepID=A0A6S6YM65_9PROT|nr:DUF3016 domain-containing protein [Denitratisoma oestradiolicum]TWO81930.1 hypothetical protein CBW56_00315 [Denitratisoma oestradiolicum]CAB1368824.1 conserved exported protein of unknown function [Denitratisoma oestradiolicum]
MKTPNSLIFLLLSLATPATLAGDVSVDFLAPEKYQDVGINQHDIDRNIRTLEQHLQKMGKQYLPTTQTLKLEILDIDLAGRYEPWQPPPLHDVRIMRSSAATWPLIKLRYTLSEGSRVLKQGEESVTDVNYLDRVSTSDRSDPLHHEKQMLEDWFRHKLSMPDN